MPNPPRDPPESAERVGHGSGRCLDGSVHHNGTMKHLSLAELEAGLDHVRAAPRDAGTVEMIVRRPSIEEREVLEEAILDASEGLVGDTWRSRSIEASDAGTPTLDSQITLMNARFVDLVAQARDRWALAGDQLYVDLDVGVENLPPGTTLTIGTAVLEITARPHTGCSKFSRRFGVDALRFVDSPTGRDLRLRGVYATVVRPGSIRRGDVVKKL